MANTATIYTRIDKDLKTNAETILAQLGISPSSAIQMLYSQIVLTNGLPFELKLPAPNPCSIADMTKSDIDKALSAGIESMKNDKLYSIDEIKELLNREFGI